MLKEQISNEYMNWMKEQHGDKKYTSFRNVAINGTLKEGSIGQYIVDHIENNYEHTKIHYRCEDVVTETFDFKNMTDLIMCHGLTHLDWIEDQPDNFEEVINVNLTGSIRLVKQFINQTIESPYRKKIISIGSMAYKSVLNGSSVYCASKAGLAHFMKCAAWELAPKGYDVYSIHPSNVEDTPMTRDTIKGLIKYRRLSEQKAKDYWGANNPRTEFLSKLEIAELVSHLLYVDRGYLSGCNLELAGGQR